MYTVMLRRWWEGTHTERHCKATCDMRGNYPLPVSFAIVIKIGAGASALDRCADRSWSWRDPACELRFHCSANATKCLSRTDSSRYSFNHFHFNIFFSVLPSPLFADFSQSYCDDKYRLPWPNCQGYIGRLYQAIILLHVP